MVLTEKDEKLFEEIGSSREEEEDAGSNAENNGVESAEDGGGITGLPAGGGVSGTSDGAGTVPTVPGAAEGEAERWMKVRRCYDEITKYLTVWDGKEELMENDMLETMYEKAVDLAAAFEQVMLARGVHE